jgi:hypothetical protein
LNRPAVYPKKRIQTGGFYNGQLLVGCHHGDSYWQPDWLHSLGGYDIGPPEKIIQGAFILDFYGKMV